MSSSGTVESRNGAMTKPSGSSRSSAVRPLRMAWRAKTTSDEKSPAPMRMHLDGPTR
tara:strand:+ start:810 stop:980 length:171 start_codon:yes stop_codon:yes gene_type:complete